ncbi:hypothetical protein ACPF3S_003187 [Vibrio cholerae]|nr:hypothetical protein [Vibrio cholerae]
MAAMINIFLYQEIKSLYRQSKAPFVMRYGCDQFRLRRDGIVFDDLSIAFKIERYFMTHPGRYLTRDQGWYTLLLSWMPFLYILPIFDGMSVWKNGEVVRSYDGVCRTCTNSLIHVCYDDVLHYCKPASPQALSVSIRRCI